VPDDGEAMKIQLRHHIRQHPSHGALADPLSSDDVVRNGRIPVPRKIRDHDREPFGELGCNFSPRQVGFGIAMEQQHCRPASAAPEIEVRTADSDALAREVPQTRVQWESPRSGASQNYADPLPRCTRLMP